MSGEIFVWWLVLLNPPSGIIVAPVPFQTEQMCEWSMEQTNGEAYGYCIPQPAADLAQFSMMSSTEGNVCEIGKP
jgi:hypothetical protein